MTTHTENDFEQMMNENYELADIAGSKYAAGYALRLVDPILFRQAYLDWLDEAGVKGDFPEIDFDTLPEWLEGCEFKHYSSIESLPLADNRSSWDDVVVVMDKSTVIHIIDSTNLDEYEYDERSGLCVSPYGHKMCSGCVDFTVYDYDFKTHSWDESDSALYEYYPEDTLEDFFKRNELI